jgi:hypothetical protein
VVIVKLNPTSWGASFINPYPCVNGFWWSWSRESLYRNSDEVLWPIIITLNSILLVKSLCIIISHWFAYVNA